MADTIRSSSVRTGSGLTAPGAAPVALRLAALARAYATGALDRAAYRAKRAEVLDALDGDSAGQGHVGGAAQDLTLELPAGTRPTSARRRRFWRPLVWALACALAVGVLLVRRVV